MNNSEHIEHKNDTIVAKIKCNICNYEFDDKSDLYAHINSDHSPEQKAPAKNNTIRCRKCDYTVDEISNLDRHMEVVHGTKCDEIVELTCRTCSFEGTFKSDME